MEPKKTTRKEVFIKVENLKVWTPEESSWLRRKVTKPKTIILNNVSVCIKAGEFVAVIGPSGAGKTTFLVSLAGKCTLPSTGSVSISGTAVKDVRRGVVEILPQFDVFMDNIGVKEHLVFMIEMKLGSIKKTQNKHILKVLLQELKLGTLENSPISSLSGGERRLLSLATSPKKTTRKEVFIKVENLKVWTPEESSWLRRKVTKPKTIILNNVSVCIKAGEFVAVIGPSGAGKTTFLVSLAGKCTLPSTGSVSISGTAVKDVRRGVVEILPQFDVFMDNIGVKEHLVFMIEMKLGSIKKTQNKHILKVLLQELKLGTLENSPISSLSGGERRLLSLATSLISGPQILICDEPTTGLDSYNASLVIGILKKLSLYGKIIICSVHQPSSDLFREFNSISLMAEGKMLFHGSKKDCKALFESLNLRCPVNYNPAEYYVKAVSMDALNKNFTHPANGCKDDGNYEYSYIVDEDTSSVAPAQFPFICQRHWMVQVQLLLWRSSLAIKKNIKFYIIQIFVSTIISSTILGTCYIGTSGTTQKGVQDLRGFLWLICSEVSFSVSYYALYAFESDLTLFKREAGVYKVSAFYVSRLLCWIPRCIIWPMVYVGLGTMAVQLPNHFITAVQFVVILILTAIASTAYGLGLGALFISTGIVGDVLPCADLPLILMSGAFLRISSLPFWLQPVKYMSHFYYGMDAISNVYWSQIDVIDCSSNSTSSCLRTGAAVLRESGYSSNFVLEDTLGMVFVSVVWSLLGYMGLKREENKGYAY